MAVVFISPKQRQKMFFLGITIIFLLFLATVFLGVFLSKPKETSSGLTFNKPKVNINMAIFDTDQFKSLTLFPEMKTQYSYRAVTKDNKTQSGFIFASSIEEARASITDMGLSVTDIKEAEIGRDNPFVPYYQVLPPTPTKAK